MNTNKFNNLNTAEVKEVVDFAERVRYMPDVKINQLRIAMQKSDTPILMKKKNTTFRIDVISKWELQIPLLH